MNFAQQAMAKAVDNTHSIAELEELVPLLDNDPVLLAHAEQHRLNLEVSFGWDELPGTVATVAAAPVAAAPAPVVDMAKALAVRRALRADLLAKIAACSDADVMVTMLVPELDLATRDADMKALRNDVKAAVQARLKALGGAKPTAADMREMFPDLVKKANRAYSLTHYGVAQRIVAETDGDLRYNINLGEWLQWDGRRWMPLLPAQVQSVARNATNKAKDEAALSGVNLDKLDVLDGDGFRRGVVGEMVAAERLHVEQRDLNTEVRYLACGNGAVDLRTGELVCQRDLLVTVRNDTEFDPEAKCPTFLRVLGEAFEGRSEDIEYYELAMGYTLQGAPTERAMFYHKGEGKNGKSLLLGAIMNALGEHAASVSNKVIADGPGQTNNTGADAASPSLRRLMERRMAFIEELPLGGNIRDADVKQLAAGSGKVPARGLNQSIIEMPLTWTFHIACNNLPTVRHGQEAVWNRIYPVVYTKQFDMTEDTSLPEKLAAESAGILAWLVRCAEKFAKVHAAGRTVRSFMPKIAQGELDKLKAEQNPLADWIAANCDVVPGAFLAASEGFNDYVAHEGSVNLDGPRNIRSVKAFVSRMKANKAFTHTEAGPDRKSGFYGLRLKTETSVLEARQKREREQAAKTDLF